MVTVVSKMASLDLNPGMFLAPDAVCASFNSWFYPPSQFGHPVLPHIDFTRPGYYGIPNAAEQASGTGHDSQCFGGTLTPFYDPGT